MEDFLHGWLIQGHGFVASMNGNGHLRRLFSFRINQYAGNENIRLRFHRELFDLVAAFQAFDGPAGLKRIRSTWKTDQFFEFLPLLFGIDAFFLLKALFTFLGAKRGIGKERAHLWRARGAGETHQLTFRKFIHFGKDARQRILLPFQPVFEPPVHVRLEFLKIPVRKIERLIGDSISGSVEVINFLRTVKGAEHFLRGKCRIFFSLCCEDQQRIRSDQAQWTPSLGECEAEGKCLAPAIVTRDIGLECANRNDGNRGFDARIHRGNPQGLVASTASPRGADLFAVHFRQ